MHFAGRNHRRNAAVKAAINPTQLVLPRRPVASDRMHVAVDQPRNKRGAVCVDHAACAFRIQQFFFSDRMNDAIYRDKGVCVEDRPFEVPAEQQSYIANDELLAAVGHGCFLNGHFSLLPPDAESLITKARLVTFLAMRISPRISQSLCSSSGRS